MKIEKYHISSLADIHRIFVFYSNNELLEPLINLIIKDVLKDFQLNNFEIKYFISRLDRKRVILETFTLLGNKLSEKIFQKVFYNIKTFFNSDIIEVSDIRKQSKLMTKYIKKNSNG